jgi:hypothetical protein
MTSQPTPTVTSTDVDRIVRRDYRAEQVPEVHAKLEEYGREAWHREAHRVRVAVLKLAAGSLHPWLKSGGINFSLLFRIMERPN